MPMTSTYSVSDVPDANTEFKPFARKPAGIGHDTMDLLNDPVWQRSETVVNAVYAVRRERFLALSAERALRCMAGLRRNRDARLSVEPAARPGNAAPSDVVGVDDVFANLERRIWVRDHHE